MKPGGSKRKGNAWERKVASDLSRWFYGDPNYLIRNLNSGAMATIRGGGVVPGGDIVQVKLDVPAFPYSVECKAFRGFNLEDILFKRQSSKSYKAWKQCTNDADKVGKFPMLVGKDNYKEPYVIVAHTIGMIYTLAEITRCNNDEVIIIQYKDLIKTTLEQCPS